MVAFKPEPFFNTLQLYFKNTMSAFIFCNKDLVPEYLNLAILSRYNFNILSWHKKTFIPLGGKHHYPDTEYCIFISKLPIFNAGLSAEHYYKYWIEDKDKIEKKDHPTAKPVKIISLQVELCSNKKGIVVDPFGGSGSTMIACHQLNRRNFMMELEPRYCQVILDRIKKLDNNLQITKL
jgi:DNA modification methylase